MGGIKIGVDVEGHPLIKIHKVIPNNSKYDHAHQKDFFENVVEMFRNMSGPSNLEFMKLSFKLTPHRPRIVIEPFV